MKRIMFILSLALASLTYAQDMGSAFVRVVHASPDAPAVDVYLDGNQTIFGAPFKAVTPYGDVSAGAHTLVVTAAGDPGAVVIEADVTLEAGVYYTVAAIGLLENISAQIFTASGLNMDSSMVELNVYHLSPDGPAVDVLAVDLDNAKVVDALSYPNMVTTTVNPMAVNVNVVPAGATEPVVGNLSGINIEGGKSYSVFAMGLLGGMGEEAFALVAVEDTVQMGSMGDMGGMMAEMAGVSYAATLSGSAVTPPADTMASGMVEARLEGNTLTVMGSFEGLSGDLRDYATDPLDPPNPNVTSAAHIHAGPSMESGPFVYNLDVALGMDGRSGSLSGVFELSDEQLEMLRMGNLYVDIHTTTFRGGELRGQLMDDAMMGDMGMGDMSHDMSAMGGMDAMLEDGTFEIALSGSQEVPPVMTEATGSASVTLLGNVLTVTGDFMGLSSPLVEIAGTPGHIHVAPVGENGGVAVLLTVSAAQDGMSGIFSAEAVLDEAQLAAFRAGHLYVNLHTENNPGGELRGQLLPMEMMGDMN